MSKRQAYIAYAMGTAQDKGAVGRNAITPRFVVDIVRPDETVLNFGAGKRDPDTGRYYHSDMLRAAGAIVNDYTFGDPKTALKYQYDIVMASNVLNVQGDRSMMWDTLMEIARSVVRGGIAVFNYPKSPKPAQIPIPEVMQMIYDVFGYPPRRVREYGNAQNPLWVVKKE